MKRVLSLLILFITLSVIITPACKEKDTNPPVITILGDNPLNYPLGVPYTDPGATALDEEDGDISANIKATIDVNTDVEGFNYSVEYTVQDKAGNKASPAIRIVHVLQF